jgi:hypothetical protein
MSEPGEQEAIAKKNVDEKTLSFLRDKSNKILSKFATSAITGSLVSAPLWTFIGLKLPGIETSAEAGILTAIGGATIIALKDVYNLRNTGNE